jgi:hypothetical protein
MLVGWFTANLAPASYSYHASSSWQKRPTRPTPLPSAASVADLVVSAMGVFVLGLYLRRWVKKRSQRGIINAGMKGREGLEEEPGSYRSSSCSSGRLGGQKTPSTSQVL